MEMRRGLQVAPGPIHAEGRAVMEVVGLPRREDRRMFRQGECQAGGPKEEGALLDKQINGPLCWASME